MSVHSTRHLLAGTLDQINETPDGPCIDDVKFMKYTNSRQYCSFAPSRCCLAIAHTSGIENPEPTTAFKKGIGRTNTIHAT